MWYSSQDSRENAISRCVICRGCGLISSILQQWTVRRGGVLSRLCPTSHYWSFRQARGFVIPPSSQNPTKTLTLGNSILLSTTINFCAFPHSRDQARFCDQSRSTGIPIICQQYLDCCLTTSPTDNHLLHATNGGRLSPHLSFFSCAKHTYTKASGHATHPPPRC